MNLKSPDARATWDGNQKQGKDKKPMPNPVRESSDDGVESHFMVLGTMWVVSISSEA